MPVEAGIQVILWLRSELEDWIPVFTGMTHTLVGANGSNPLFTLASVRQPTDRRDLAQFPPELLP